MGVPSLSLGLAWGSLCIAATAVWQLAALSAIVPTVPEYPPSLSINSNSNSGLSAKRFESSSPRPNWNVQIGPGYVLLNHAGDMPAPRRWAVQTAAHTEIAGGDMVVHPLFHAEAAEVAQEYDCRNADDSDHVDAASCPRKTGSYGWSCDRS